MLVQKVLILVSLTATRPEVSVATTTIFLSDSFEALEETLTHMKSFKLKSYPGDNVIDFCAKILVDLKNFQSAMTSKPGNLG